MCTRSGWSGFFWYRFGQVNSRALTSAIDLTSALAFNREHNEKVSIISQYKQWKDSAA